MSVRYRVLMVAACVLATASAHAAPDARQEVRFPASVRAQFLASMRGHLAALNDILGELATGRLMAAAETAELRLGMSAMAQDMDRQLPYMPAGMRELGMRMHQGAGRFARVAQDAAVTGKVQAAYAALHQVTEACVACHAAYRVR